MRMREIWFNSSMVTVLGKPTLFQCVKGLSRVFTHEIIIYLCRNFRGFRMLGFSMDRKKVLGDIIRCVDLRHFAFRRVSLMGRALFMSILFN